MKKVLIVLGLAASCTTLGYLARDGLEMKKIRDMLSPSTSEMAPASQPAANTPITPAIETSDQYQPPIRLVPTWPQYIDPSPRGDRTATPNLAPPAR